ncbi:M4 family metallopeptidase [Lysobacter sp. Root983]|uniref:M4 family metallopeptidase n=1 Tax=Lysobacter sp. Root983 TaxID=1736613 RepID=UPI000AE47AB9|nr:M4 family metallopeptidase [Lysobacter sp. Root983]
MRPSFVAIAVSLSLAALMPATSNASQPNGSVVSGTGHGVHYGTLPIPVQYTAGFGYELIDNTRNGISSSDGGGFNRYYATYRGPQQFVSPTTSFGDGSAASLSSMGVDAYYAMQRSWDYFKLVHARNGLDARNRRATVYSHVVDLAPGRKTTGYSYWSGTTVLLGIGDAAAGIEPLATLDIVGSMYAANIVYNTDPDPGRGDSQGVRSSIADVFGTLIEFHAAHPNDPGDYVIGELAYPGGLRHMYRQNLDGKSFVCYPARGFDPNDESPAYSGEYTSGIGNRAFYLLAEGATAPAGSGLSADQLVCNGDTAIVGIGRAKAGAIWYRLATTEKTSQLTYPQARAATIRAAEALYGVKSAEARAVARAWSAAGVK